MSDTLDKDLTASSIGDAFKQCIIHMKVWLSSVLASLVLANIPLTP